MLKEATTCERALQTEGNTVQLDTFRVSPCGLFVQQQNARRKKKNTRRHPALLFVPVPPSQMLPHTKHLKHWHLQETTER